MRWLLDHGANVEATDFMQETPLYYAAVWGHCDAAVLLLDAGARVDASDGERESALDQAASEGDLEMCKLLVSRGASLDARYNDGGDAESLARFYAGALEEQPTTADFLAAVRAAGGWKPYVDAPRRELLALRRELPSLRERGRATPSDDRLYERLFHDARVPDDVFTHVLSYWRTPRDFTYTPRDA